MAHNALLNSTGQFVFHLLSFFILPLSLQSLIPAGGSHLTLPALWPSSMALAHDNLTQWATDWPSYNVLDPHSPTQCPPATHLFSFFTSLPFTSLQSTSLLFPSLSHFLFLFLLPVSNHFILLLWLLTLSGNLEVTAGADNRNHLLLYSSTR